MIIYVNITDRRTDRQTDRQTDKHIRSIVRIEIDLNLDLKNGLNITMKLKKITCLFIKWNLTYNVNFY